MQFLGGSLAALIQPRRLRYGSRVRCWTDQPGQARQDRSIRTALEPTHYAGAANLGLS